MLIVLIKVTIGFSPCRVLVSADVKAGVQGRENRGQMVHLLRAVHQQFGALCRCQGLQAAGNPAGVGTRGSEREGAMP